MAWSHVKNLVIALLIAVDAFLLIVYGVTTWRENQYKDQMNEELIAAAASLGITLDKDMTQPEVETLLPLRAYEDETADLEIARGLLGPCEGVKTGDGAFVYQNERGSLTLHNDGAVELNLMLETPIKTERKAKDAVRQVLRVLKQESTDPVFQTANPDQDFVASVQLTASGVSVFNASLAFEFYHDVLVVTGRRILHTPKQIRSEEIQELPGVLLSLIGYWKDRNILDKTITGIELGYLAKTTGGKNMTVLPVWHVSEEQGDWYISAVDGSITSPE